MPIQAAFGALERLWPQLIVGIGHYVANAKSAVQLIKCRGAKAIVVGATQRELIMYAIRDTCLWIDSASLLRNDPSCRQSSVAQQHLPTCCVGVGPAIEPRTELDHPAACRSEQVLNKNPPKLLASPSYLVASRLTARIVQLFAVAANPLPVHPESE